MAHQKDDREGAGEIWVGSPNRSGSIGGYTYLYPLQSPSLSPSLEGRFPDGSPWVSVDFLERTAQTPFFFGSQKNYAVSLIILGFSVYIWFFVAKNINVYKYYYKNILVSSFI